MNRLEIADVRANAFSVPGSGGEYHDRERGHWLIDSRSVDILQPVMMWLGGPSEAPRVSAMVAAYDIPVVPHSSGAYSYHFVMAQPHSPFCEYLVTGANATRVEPMFGTLFEIKVCLRTAASTPPASPASVSDCAMVACRSTGRMSGPEGDCSA